MAGSTESTYLFDNRASEAEDRFRGLQDVFDPVTFAHLSATGIAEGWHCWEVGAGGGSVASWMADRVAPSGRVLATDIDPSWVAGERPGNVDVRVQDVALDEPPDADFDLIHARLVLVHILGRDTALVKMVHALRPGGWLVLEDFDMDLVAPACVDDQAPYAELAQKIQTALQDLLAVRGVDRQYGRKLPRLLRERGLTDVTGSAFYPVAHAGSRLVLRANIGQVGDALVRSGLATPPEVEEYLALTKDDEVDLVTPPLFSVMGRKPPAG